MKNHGCDPQLERDPEEGETMRQSFLVTFDAGGGLLGKVTVTKRHLDDDPALPAQRVTFDDPSLPYLLTGDVYERRVQRVELRARDVGQSIRQQDLGTGNRAVIKVLRDWAGLGRWFQEQLADVAALEADETVPESTRQARRAALANLRTGIWAGRASQAVEQTRQQLAALSVTGKRRTRARGEDKKELQRRVVDAYREAVRRGERAPVQKVADELSYHPVHISRILSSARRDGLDVPATRKKAKR